MIRLRYLTISIIAVCVISIIPFGSSALDPGEGETKMGEINDI